MKKLLLILCIFVMVTYQSIAIPAHRSPITITQPDGSSVTIQLQGDEWIHYNTTNDGYSVVKNDKGYYVYAELKEGRLIPTNFVAHDIKERKAAECEFLHNRKKYQAPMITPQAASIRNANQRYRQEKIAKRKAAQKQGNDCKELHGLVILIQYKDKSFSVPECTNFFNDMINKEGYDGYIDENNEKQECTGSLYDYFYENSNGTLKTNFDIAGPYTVDFSQYDSKMGYQGEDAKDSKRTEILLAAIDSADIDIDFAQYDNDGDGKVDFLYFIIAGMGSNYTGNNKGLWWPHKSILYIAYDEEDRRWKGVTKDGVELFEYASSTEMFGWESKPELIKPDGIGTICHEFGHVLGLPDFYDTDDENNGGNSNTLGIWSVMDIGCYCNDSRTPVAYSLYERILAGFPVEANPIESTGNYVLRPLPTSLQGLYIDTSDENEFFILENRNKDACKWDAYLPGSGMIVYHTDITNNDAWNNNRINCDPSHNYYRMLFAGGEHKKENGSYAKTDADVFPGTANVTELTNESTPANLLSWNGEPCKWILKNITQDEQDITFDVIEATSTDIPGIQRENKVSEGQRYNLQGQPVGKEYKGIIIIDGHKRM